MEGGSSLRDISFILLLVESLLLFISQLLHTKYLFSQNGAIFFNQNAAKTAQQLVVFVTRKDLWRKRAKANLAFMDSVFGKNNPKSESEWGLHMPISYFYIFFYSFFLRTAPASPYSVRLSPFFSLVTAYFACPGEEELRPLLSSIR